MKVDTNRKGTHAEDSYNNRNTDRVATHFMHTHHVHSSRGRVNEVCSSVF